NFTYTRFEQQAPKPATTSEAVFQRELDHSRIHVVGCDLSEGSRSHVRKRICGSRTVVRIGELRMIKRVEKFGAELDRMVFLDTDLFQQRHIPVELTGAKNDTDPRIAIVGTVSDNGRRAERALVEITWAAACATQSLFDST